jgi:hypothetical protein
MGNAWKAGVCVLAISVLAGGTAEAAKRPSSLKCAQPTEVTAIQSTVVDQQLGIAAMLCGPATLDNFNHYRDTFGPEILKDDKLVQAMFRRVYGSKGDLEYHTFKTNLNGHAELVRIKDTVGFCRAADLVLAAANVTPRPSLRDFVAGVPVTQTETPVQTCAISVPVDLKGVKALPMVVPRPRPPQPDDPPVAEEAPPAPPAPAGVKVGSLTCNISSGFGFIFGSEKTLKCTYAPNSGRGEHYTGTFSKYGLDVGFADQGVLVWGVVAPTSDIRPGALEGEYAGATAGATIGIGLGANVLIGGLDKSIALQPVSVQGSTGLNVSAGVGVITLKFEP